MHGLSQKWLLTQKSCRCEMRRIVLAPLLGYFGLLISCTFLRHHSKTSGTSWQLLCRHCFLLSDFASSSAPLSWHHTSLSVHFWNSRCCGITKAFQRQHYHRLISAVLIAAIICSFWLVVCAHTHGATTWWMIYRVLLLRSRPLFALPFLNWNDSRSSRLLSFLLLKACRNFGDFFVGRCADNHFASAFLFDVVGRRTLF